MTAIICETFSQHDILFRQKGKKMSEDYIEYYKAHHLKPDANL